VDDLPRQLVIRLDLSKVVPKAQGRVVNHDEDIHRHFEFVVLLLLRPPIILGLFFQDQSLFELRAPLGNDYY